MYYVARSLMKVQSLFGIIPRITGKGVGARVRPACLAWLEARPAMP